MIPLWGAQLKQTVPCAALQQAGLSSSLGHNIFCLTELWKNLMPSVRRFSLKYFHLPLTSFDKKKKNYINLNNLCLTFFKRSAALKFFSLSKKFPHFFHPLLWLKLLDFLLVYMSNTLVHHAVFMFLVRWSSLAFLSLLFSGAVLLVSVQGISVNVDPVFCTWLLYQPHKGSSRKQQQVFNSDSCSYTLFANMSSSLAFHSQISFLQPIWSQMKVSALQSCFDLL